MAHLCRSRLEVRGLVLLLLLLLSCALHAHANASRRRLRHRLFPVRRGNSAEPPGLIPTTSVLPEGDGYAMDLHPLRSKEGKGQPIPCGLSNDKLQDPYASRKLNLIIGDEDGGGGGGGDKDADGCYHDTPEGDVLEASGDAKGSGLVWLLGDPTKAPPVDPPAA